MTERKRTTKKRPAYRLPKVQQEEEDLKKVKAQTLKDLEESEKDKKEWYDNELDKNLKKL